MNKKNKHSYHFIAIDIVSGIIVGVLIGFWLDKIFMTKPILLVICLLFGFAGGFYNAIRSIK